MGNSFCLYKSPFSSGYPLKWVSKHSGNHSIITGRHILGASFCLFYRLIRKLVGILLKFNVPMAIFSYNWL